MKSNNHGWRRIVSEQFCQPTKTVVISLLNEQYSLAASASILGISPHTLKKYCDERGIKFKRYASASGEKRRKHVFTKPHHRQRLLTLNGVTQNATAWENQTGLSARTIISRIDRYGWSVERALTEAVGTTPRGRRSR